MTTPSYIKAPPSSDIASSSESEERQASSASKVLTGEDEVVVRGKPEPGALTESDVLVSEMRGVLPEYTLCASLQVLVILEGAPLRTGRQDFERRIRTCTSSSTTTATTTMTKAHAAAYLSFWTKSPSGHVRFASNGDRCRYPVTAGHVWFPRGRRAAVLRESLAVGGEEEDVNTSERRTPGARYRHLLATHSPSSRHRRHALQGCDAASWFSPSGSRRRSNAAPARPETLLESRGLQCSAGSS